MPLPQEAHDLPGGDLAEYVPPQIRKLKYCQTLIPAIAKDRRLMAAVDDAVRRIPTRHALYCADARGIGYRREGSNARFRSDTGNDR